MKDRRKSRIINGIGITIIGMLLVAILLGLERALTDPPTKTKAETQHVATVHKFHATMHEAKMSHSHPMPMPARRKQPAGY